MIPLWIMQKSLISEQDSIGMTLAIEKAGCKWQPLEVKSFDYDHIPDVNYDGPIIPYGGTIFINSAQKIKPWVFWFNDNFSYKIYLEKYGQKMFNSDAQCMKMREFSPSLFPKNEFLFIRPDKDLKEFAGENVKPEDFMGWLRRIQGKGYNINEDTNIVVAKSSRIGKEWRTYVVDGEPVGGSQYRDDHYLKPSSYVPQEVYEFVRQMVKIWTPSPVFIMDICELNGELYILELGDFHSCGWYESNKEL